MRSIGFALIACSLLFWFSGGALIISAHRQRTGQRGSWPFKNFNSRERWLLRLLKLVVLIVGGVGLAMSQGAIG
jgi:hypothetical protein